MPDKEMQCPLCSKRFATSTSFLQHAKNHAEEEEEKELKVVKVVVNIKTEQEANSVVENLLQETATSSNCSKCTSQNNLPVISSSYSLERSNTTLNTNKKPTLSCSIVEKENVITEVEEKDEIQVLDLNKLCGVSKTLLQENEKLLISKIAKISSLKESTIELQNNEFGLEESMCAEKEQPDKVQHSDFEGLHKEEPDLGDFEVENSENVNGFGTLIKDAAESINEENGPECLKSYKCSECSKLFRSKEILEIHYKKVHEGLKQVKCPKCPRVFNNQSTFIRHFTTVHDGIKAYKCPQCSRLYKSRQSMQIHTMTFHEGIKPYKCPICPKNFNTEWTLQIHCKNVHKGIKSFKCSKCPKFLSSKNNMQTHIRTDHNEEKSNLGEMEVENSDLIEEKLMDNKDATEDIVLKCEPRTYTCPQCPSQFAHRHRMKIHLNTVHNPLKRYKCTMCAMTFHHKSNLIRHNKTVHQGISAYKCPHCSKLLKAKQNLQIHIKRAHKGLKVPNSGELTTSYKKGISVVNTRNRLSRKAKEQKRQIKDMVEHSEMEGPDKEDCDFIVVNDLQIGATESVKDQNACVDIKPKRDVPINTFPTDTKPLSCPICAKSFSVEQLKTHCKIAHRGLKCFKCPQCPMVFNHKGNFLRHFTTVHENLRAYKCTICPKAYKSSQYLEKHCKKVHGSSKPYKPFECPQCPKSFSLKTGMQIHIKTVHEGLKPFKCPQCLKNFTQKGSMNLHFKNAHKNNCPDNEKMDKALTSGELATTGCNKGLSISNARIKLDRRAKEQKCEITDKAEESNISGSDKEDSGVPNSNKEQYLRKDVGNKEVKETIIEQNKMVTDTKPCKKEFSNQSNLKTKSPKEYKCPNCPKIFPHHGNYIRHIKLVHYQIKSFKCPGCSKVFKSNQYMQFHNKKVHEGLNITR